MPLRGDGPPQRYQQVSDDEQRERRAEQRQEQPHGHGKNPGDTNRVVEELMRETGVTDNQTLASLRELKKTSMRYF